MNSGAGVGLLMERDALAENEFHRADVPVEVELGLMVALASSALAPDICGTLDAEFACNNDDVIIAIDPRFIAIDPRFASESIRRFSGYLDLVRAAPLMQAGAPVGSPGDSSARLRAANSFEIEPRLWSELNGLAQSSWSVTRGYAS
jgi:LDH2 family malate/lactate/ureidoglycolate dehydrogenase